jgi:adenosylcobyric acid synthase
VKGLVVNKFRGDIRLLQDGLDMIAERTGVPVLGVVPYIRDVGVAEEDSVALEEKRRTPPRPGSIDVAVIRLPHISNFDDFDPLETEAGVSLRYVEDVAALGEPDLVILPGTKTTVADLRHIQAIGLARRLRDLASAGTPVLGICGGYQMLGARMLDPEGVESRESEVDGLGLLPVTTTFTRKKRTCRVEGHVTAAAGALGAAAGQRVVGYEIHMGVTDGSASPAIRLERRLGEPVEDVDGGMDERGVVAGTYIHGLFANVGLRRAMLDWLARRKGLTLSYGEDATREAAYDRLAEVVRSSLDMGRVRELCGIT